MSKQLDAWCRKPEDHWMHMSWDWCFRKPAEGRGYMFWIINLFHKLLPPWYHNVGAPWCSLFFQVLNICFLCLPAQATSSLIWLKAPNKLIMFNGLLILTVCMWVATHLFFNKCTVSITLRLHTLSCFINYYFRRCLVMVAHICISVLVSFNIFHIVCLLYWM